MTILNRWQKTKRDYRRAERKGDIPGMLAAMNDCIAQIEHCKGNLTRLLRGAREERLRLLAELVERV